MPFIHRRPGDIARGVTLDCQSHLPESDRIQWDVKILDVAGADQYERDLDEAYDGKSTSREKAEGIKKVIAGIAVGWSNVVDESGNPVAFGPEALDQFNLQKLYQIARQLPSAAGWGGLSPKS